MSRYDQQLFEYFQILDRKRYAQPLVLGGVTGSGGGIGYPPGGFVGQLPQTQVCYDLSELAINTTVISGSLVDNLNHIRYRINELETWSTTVSGISGSGISGSGASTFLELLDTPDSYLGYGGKVVVVNLAENALEFTDIAGGDSGNTIILKHGDGSANDSFTADEDGLDSANLASISGDKILIPICELTRDYTLVEGVTYEGEDNQLTIINGRITMSPSSRLQKLTLSRIGEFRDRVGGLDPSDTILAPASGKAFINDCIIIYTNTDYTHMDVPYNAAIGSTDGGELSINGCEIYSSGFEANAVYCIDGIVTIKNSLIRSTDVLTGEEGL